MISDCIHPSHRQLYFSLIGSDASELIAMAFSDGQWILVGPISIAATVFPVSDRGIYYITYVDKVCVEMVLNFWENDTKHRTDAFFWLISRRALCLFSTVAMAVKPRPTCRTATPTVYPIKSAQSAAQDAHRQIPIPLSVTDRCTSPSSSSRMISIMPPDGVYWWHLKPINNCTVQMASMPKIFLSVSRWISIRCPRLLWSAIKHLHQQAWHVDLSRWLGFVTFRRDGPK